MSRTWIGVAIYCFLRPWATAGARTLRYMRAASPIVPLGSCLCLLAYCETDSPARFAADFRRPGCFIAELINLSAMRLLLSAARNDRTHSTRASGGGLVPHAFW